MYTFKSKVHQIRRFWSASMIKLIGVDLKVRGSLNTEADVILLNHNSMLDIILLDFLHPKDLCWVANEKLSKVPVFGQIFKLTNLILINPAKSSSFGIMSDKIKEEMMNDRPIGIFPEGTRGNDDKIIKFKKGIKRVAEDLNLSVQPIILVNTKKRLNTKDFSASAGVVKVIYLDTIETYSKNWYKNLEDQFNKIYTQEKVKI